jgi:hypothetical protein
VKNSLSKVNKKPKTEGTRQPLKLLQNRRYYYAATLVRFCNFIDINTITQKFIQKQIPQITRYAATLKITAKTKIFWSPSWYNNILLYNYKQKINKLNKGLNLLPVFKPNNSFKNFVAVSLHLQGGGK